MTLATSILGVDCHCSLGFNTVYLCAKFDDSSFSRSRDIIGASKFSGSRDSGHASFNGDLSS